MENQEKAVIGKEYSKSLVKWGRLTNCIGIVCGFLPVIILLVVYGFRPDWTAFGVAFAAIAAAVSIGWLTDPVAYVPIFGAGGTMMAFLSGNANALRLPAVVVGTDVAGTERGTPENEVITILSMCASVAMSTLVLTICAIGGTRLLEALPTSITSLFNFMLPAVFGGVITLPHSLLCHLSAAPLRHQVRHPAQVYVRPDHHHLHRRHHYLRHHQAQQKGEEGGRSQRISRRNDSSISKTRSI